MRKEKPSQPLSQESAPEPRVGEMEEDIPIPHLTTPQAPTPRRSGNALRAGLAVFAGRTVGAVSRRLHLGGGTSIVGIVAQRVYPGIVQHLANELEHGSITITGTNGKTTTSNFLADIFRAAGLRVWHNKEGSNMMRGIATTLVNRAQNNGHLRDSEGALSIFEVDEAALPEVVRATPPRIAVFTNLFRDQLDRYGEVDSILTLWEKMIRQLPPTTTMILNADDPAIANLGREYPGRVVYYGADVSAFEGLEFQKGRGDHETLDARVCPLCDTPYTYDVLFYSHMGHYHCSNCLQTKRPEPEFRLTRIEALSFDRFLVHIATKTQTYELVIPLPGLYNIYNALTAITTALVQGIEWPAIKEGIEAFQPAFGRGERVAADGRSLRLLLAKNPTGFNEVLRTLFSDEEKKHVLIYLNDNIADGQDISWIWDVDFERATGHTKKITVSGTRALDLAIRLKYAGQSIDDLTVIPSVPFRQQAKKRSLLSLNPFKRGPKMTTIEDSNLPQPHLYGLKTALDFAIQQTPVGETLFIVPTYTALLELRRELENRGLTTRYWEEKK